MNLAFTSIVKNADGSWSFTWADTGADTYRAVLWGRLLKETAELTFATNGVGYQNFPPPVEVVELGNLAISELHSPYIVFQWYGEGCSYYAVQEKVGSDWVISQNVTDDGSWIFSYVSRILTDDALSEFRVIAVDYLGNESTPRRFSRQVVRPPDVVDSALTFDYTPGTHTVTIDEV